MHRKRVLYIVEDLERGGAERVVVSLATRLDRARFEPAVCCLAKPGGLAGEIERAGVPLHVLGKRPGIDLRLLWRLYRLIKRLKPDVIHTHLFTGNAWGRAAAWLAGTKRIIASEHSVDLWKNGVRRFVDRALAIPSFRVVAKSEAIADFCRTVEHIPERKVITIRNGIDVSRYNNGFDHEEVRRAIGLPRDAMVVGTVGRLSPEKGHEVLIEALKRLKADLPGLSAVVAGDGPLRGEVHRVLRAKGMEGTMRLLGYREDVPALLAAMDIFVLPSHREGMPLALLEAMAARLPVIATNVGGCREVIVNGKNGFLVPPARPDMLAEAIRCLANKAELRRSFGDEAGRTVEERFSIEMMVRKMEELYQCSS
jgi:sugar transferase (PEP-CTERM/EpsH1 system associated)